ncbi:MAG: exodeoxyribonuclease VII large subunit [Methylococcales bacterium]|nr:exodeoxyribonuclease VII large subunit [Methylococcales bacterium]
MFNTSILENKIYSVSQLNRETKNLLSDHFSYVQVEGEISNLSNPSSGHIYFSLKDKKAQIRCAMFKSQLRRLKFKPENGKQIILTAQVSLYEARGDYQLIVDKMQEAGEGALQIAFEQLKKKLQNEGLFDLSLKKNLPEIPSQIGVITSPSGAAIHDVLSVLKRRFPAIPVIIYPTAVQGNLAKSEIVSALETANKQKQVDVIILTRGGGSIEDLWSFNEESVARAIVKSKIPVISGIGHDVDFTIADFVADLRAPTPSVAAESTVPNQSTWLSTFQSLENQLIKTIQLHILNYQQSTNWINKRLQQQHPGQKLKHHAQTLDHLESRLAHAINNKIQHNKHLLKNKLTIFHQHNPSSKIARYKEQQHYLYIRLNNTIKRQLKNLQRQHLSLVQTLHAVSPLATLERGYSIVTEPESSTVISSTQKLSINDKIKTRFAHGELISQIMDIKHD